MRSSATPPTLASLAGVLPAYGARFDKTLAAARATIGPDCDPANPDHAAALRVWLNKWICRIRVPTPGEPDPFRSNLAAWWMSAAQLLPDRHITLASLTDAQIGSVAKAYASLEPQIAAIDRNGRPRTFGPTATAKVLYFVRPEAVTAWDKAISRHVPVAGGEPAFAAHLDVCRSWARELVAEAAEQGVDEADIGQFLGRPESSVAKLIDEWLYRTITGGINPAT